MCLRYYGRCLFEGSLCSPQIFLTNALIVMCFINWCVHLLQTFFYFGVCHFSTKLVRWYSSEWARTCSKQVGSTANHSTVHTGSTSVRLPQTASDTQPPCPGTTTTKPWSTGPDIPPNASSLSQGTANPMIPTLTLVRAGCGGECVPH